MWFHSALVIGCKKWLEVHFSSFIFKEKKFSHLDHCLNLSSFYLLPFLLGHKKRKLFWLSFLTFSLAPEQYYYVGFMKLFLITYWFSNCGFCRWRKPVYHHKVKQSLSLLKYGSYTAYFVFYSVHCFMYMVPRLHCWRNFNMWLASQWWKWIWEDWNSENSNAVLGCHWGCQWNRT